VRIYSALALRKAVKAIPEIVQEIEKHLKSEDEALFKSAIISLSDIIRNVGPQIIDPGIRKRLISNFISFLENRDVEVRKNVILALGDILEVETEVLEEVIPTLIEKIEAKEWEERHSVSQVLRTRIRRNKKSMEKILPYLLEMGRKPSKEVRREIVVMLKEVVVKGGKPLEKSLPLLLELAKDKDPVVKFEAITTIEKIPPDHIKILKAYFPKLEQIMIENKNQKIRKIFSLIKEKIDENKI
jgi:HEAT repeat protein